MQEGSFFLIVWGATSTGEENLKGKEILPFPLNFPPP